MAGNAWAATVTFYVASGDDDGYVYAGKTTNPPSYSDYNKTSAFYSTRKWFYNGTSYFVDIGLVRFNTSALPDDAQITGAKLKVYTKYVSGSTRNINCEYFEGTWTWGSGMYTTSELGTTAFQVALSSFTTNSTTEITLSNPTSINRTGYTAFRMCPPGSITSSRDEAQFATYEDTQKGSILEVTYSTAPGIPGNPTFTNVANKSMTISWTAATGATSYTLQRNGSNISTSATSPYNDSGLSVATSYTYRVIAVNADGSTNCAADQSQTTTYWSKKMNGSTVKKINGTYVDKVNGL